jgi:hypothetical protein
MKNRKMHRENTFFEEYAKKISLYIMKDVAINSQPNRKGAR